jgi:hypothetical protein
MVANMHETASGNVDRKDHECRDEWETGICTICAGPEPCSKRACMDALSAQADYAEGTIEGPDWKYK